MAFFPLFLDLDGMPVLVVGGGTIATRRVAALVEFGANVCVVAPAVTDGIRDMIAAGRISWRQTEYDSRDMDSMLLALAATNDRFVNHQVGADAKSRGIPVSVADAREECTFYFPALATGSGLTAGIISPAGNHQLVAKAAAIIRDKLEQLDGNNTANTGRGEG